MHVASKCTFRSLLLCLPLVWAASPTVQAAAETYGYKLSAAGIYIWDISGSYDVTYETDYYATAGDSTKHFFVTIAQDSKGKLHGSGNQTVYYYSHDYDEELEIPMTYTITGSVTQSKGVTKVKMTMKFKGTITTWDDEKISETYAVQAQVDPETAEMVGTTKGSWKWGHNPTDHDTYTFQKALPEDMDGSATLTPTIELSGKKATGSAGLQLSNGHTYLLTAKGTVNAKKNEGTITLTSSSEKFSLKVYMNLTTHALTKLTGTVLGQKLQGQNMPLSPQP